MVSAEGRGGGKYAPIRAPNLAILPRAICILKNGAEKGGGCFGTIGVK